MGEVTHPAVFEMKDKESLGSLIAMAGGVRFDAYVERIHVERIIPVRAAEFISAEYPRHRHSFCLVDGHAEEPAALEDGDVVAIFKIDGLAENRVSIWGTR